MSEITLRFSKECLYDVEWQVRRVSLLKQYNANKVGFSTREGVIANIDLLRDYFMQADLEVDAALRCYRIINLMAATMLGYKKEQTDLINLCKKYHQEMATIYKARDWGQHISGASGLKWDWIKVKADLEKLWREDREMFDNIWENLQSRVGIANRKQRLGIGGMQFRNELQKFISLMVEVSGRDES